MPIVAIDAMGGDIGCDSVLAGVVDSFAQRDFFAILVGDESKIRKSIPTEYKNRFDVVNCENNFSVEEPAVNIFKQKDSSIYKCIDLVASNKADAVLSAGHSGAMMSLAVVKIGKLDGVIRPAIATLLPSLQGHYNVVLDVGANIDCKPEVLFQFAVMGKIYSKDVLKKDSPKIALLSNGEESSKGNDVTKVAYSLLKEIPGFIGNIEGDSIFLGDADVIVTDGFVGNILLKIAEGTASFMQTKLKIYLRKSIATIIGAALTSKAFKALKKDVDYTEYGAAPLVGLKKCVMVSHGKSNSKAIKNAVLRTVDFADSTTNKDIEASIKDYLGAVKT